MTDTTFGNVKANSTYEEMVKEIERLKPGFKVKLREDLVNGVIYRLKYSQTYCRYYQHKQPLECGEVYKIIEIDTLDKSLYLHTDTSSAVWIPYNMVDIDWLYDIQNMATILKSCKTEQSKCETEEKDFYQQAQDLNENAHKELQEAVDKLNEAIAKVRAVNKVVGVRDVDGCRMYSIRAIRLSVEDTRRIDLFLLK